MAKFYKVAFPLNLSIFFKKIVQNNIPKKYMMSKSTKLEIIFS